MATNPECGRGDSTVVIIDDDSDVRALFADLVGDDGRFRLLGSFPSARLGMDFVRESPVDAIVLDNHMRELSGFAALPMLREMCPDTCLLLWSSGGCTAPEAMAQGADFVLEKGASALRVLDVLHDFVSARA